MDSPIVLSSDESDDDDVVVVCETKAEPKDLDDDGDIVILSVEKRDSVQIQEKNGIETTSATDSSGDRVDLTATEAEKPGEALTTSSSQEPPGGTPSNKDSSVEPVDLSLSTKPSSGGPVNTDTNNSGFLGKSLHQSDDKDMVLMGIPNNLSRSSVSSLVVKPSDDTDGQTLQSSRGYQLIDASAKLPGSPTSPFLSLTDTDQSSTVHTTTSSTTVSALSSFPSGINSVDSGKTVTSNPATRLPNSWGSPSYENIRSYLLPQSSMPSQKDDFAVTPQTSAASIPSINRSLSCTSNSTLTGFTCTRYRCHPRKRLHSDSQVVQQACSSLVPATWSTYCTVCGEQGRKVSHCMQRHQTCCICLEERAKCILSEKKGVTLRCLSSGCDSFYPMSELKHTLPGMVVDVLEIQLEKHYVDYLADMVLKEATGEEEDIPPKTETEKTEPEPVQSKPNVAMDVPSSWIEMDQNTPFTLVPLEPETEAYVSVSLKFHETMQFGLMDIEKIYRVQNPILWKFYSVKKQQMKLDHGGEQIEEKLLFHGTNDEAVDAICKSGFDWRLCGKHGTMYGQGSYFAKTASYSHQYSAAAAKVNRARNVRKAKRYCMMAKKNKLLNTLSTAVSSNAALNLLYFPANPTMATPVSSSYNSHAYNPPLGSSTASSAASHCNSPSSNMVGTSSTGIALSPVQHHATGLGWKSTQASSNPLNLSVASYSGTLVAPNTSTAPHVSMSSSGAVTSSSGGPMFTNIMTQHTLAPIVNHLLRSQVNSYGPSAPTGYGSTPIAQPSTSSPQTESDSPVFKMFLARVLVGNYTIGNGGLRKPPPLHADSDPYGMCFDSCVDNEQSPKIFVVFDSAQAYPEYIVHYKHNTDQ